MECVNFDKILLVTFKWNVILSIRGITNDKKRSKLTHQNIFQLQMNDRIKFNMSFVADFIFLLMGAIYILCNGILLFGILNVSKISDATKWIDFHLLYLIEQTIGDFIVYYSCNNWKKCLSHHLWRFSIRRRKWIWNWDFGRNDDFLLDHKLSWSSRQFLSPIYYMIIVN